MLSYELPNFSGERLGLVRNYLLAFDVVQLVCNKFVERYVLQSAHPCPPSQLMIIHEREKRKAFYAHSSSRRQKPPSRRRTGQRFRRAPFVHLNAKSNANSKTCWLPGQR